MDLRSVAVELPRWEPFIRRFVAKDWMRSRLAVETDDVRQECRIRALQALAQIRSKTPHLAGTKDEIRIVNRAIARAFADLIRKAARQSRRLDETAIYSIVSGASWLPAAQTTTLEEDYLATEAAEYVRLMCVEIRTAIGDEIYADVLASLDEERVKGTSRQDVLRRSRNRRSAIQAARAAVAGVPQKKKKRQKMERPAASLNDDDLARVALVYKRTHGCKIENGTRAHLLAKVEGVNSDDGAPFPFPPCFTDPTQYDPADSSCGVECDFRVECAACIPAHRDASIEEQLVQLRGGKAEKASKAKEKEAPKVNPALSLDADGNPADVHDGGTHAMPQKAKEKEPKAKEKEPKAKEKEAPKAKEKEAPKAKEKEAPKAKEKEAPKAKEPKASTGQPSPKAWAEAEAKEKEKEAPKAKEKEPKTKEKEPKTKEKKPPKAKAKEPKAKEPKAKEKKAPKEKKRRRISAPVSLSGRKTAMTAPYLLREDGTRLHVRLPQGSAVALAALPVGTVLRRDFNGQLFVAKKIQDGAVVDGVKRDGVWGLEGESLTGSLGVITRFVTKANNWSASRFWSVIPSCLDPKHPDFNPSKWKPASIYDYSGERAKKRAARKAKKKQKKAVAA